jgi:hypothetical protein
MRAKFMDAQFARNRRLAASSHQTRPWFVRVDQWLEGTRAAESTPAVFFDGPDDNVAVAGGGGAGGQQVRRGGQGGICPRWLMCQCGWHLSQGELLHYNHLVHNHCTA